MLKIIVTDDREEKNTDYKKILQENENLLMRVQEKEMCYRDSLGWLDTEEWASEKHLLKLEKLAEEVRREADTFVLIGVGGSNNAARSVIEALKDVNPSSDRAPEILYAGNTLSPYALRKILSRLHGKSVYINCIAKNFETLEPGASFRILRQYLFQKYGEDARRRIICTGTKGSSLETLCGEQGYRFLEFPVNVGGRYTAITSVGLFPMAVAGVHIRELVKGAKEMEKLLHETRGQKNSAYFYACLRNFYYRNGYRMEMLSSFEPQFRWFYKWWIQLFAESEGKENRGIFPVSGEFSEELHSIGQFLQEGSPLIFETFLHVKQQKEKLVIPADGQRDFFEYLDGKDLHKINEAAFEATRKAHSKKLPCITIEIDKIDAYHFGQLFYFFQFACYLSARILGVKPFDQPGVEAYKIRMFEALGKGRTAR